MLLSLFLITFASAQSDEVKIGKVNACLDLSKIKLEEDEAKIKDIIEKSKIEPDTIT